MNQSVSSHSRFSIWLSYFLIVFSMSAGLSLITPHYGGPDEPEHMVYLYAAFNESIPMDSDVHEVPQWLTQSDPHCWIGKYEKSANCSGDVNTANTTPLSISSKATNYPPLYYLLVGWPLSFLDGTTALRVIRLLSSLIFAALTALGLTFLRTRHTRQQHPSDILALLVITPSCYALSGFLQPQALEIGAAIALAGILLPLAHISDMNMREVSRRFVWAIPITLFLVFSRTTGMWWAFMICLLVLITLTKSQITALVRLRYFWIYVASSALWSILSLAWTSSTKDWYEFHTELTNTGSCTITECILPNALHYSQAAAITAVTGWNDTRASIPVILLYWVLLAFLILLAVRSKKAKVIIASVFVCAIYVLSSVVMSISWVDIWGGPIWQGRYALPLIIPYLIFIADTVSTSTTVSDKTWRWLSRIASLVLAILFMNFALRATLRFWSGLGNGVNILQAPFHSPPLAQVGLVLCTLACIVLCAIVWHASAYTNKTRDKAISDGKSKLDSNENESSDKISS